MAESHDWRMYILPGMDGTGILLEDFAACLPADWRPRIVRFPTHEVLGYDELERQVLPEIQNDLPVVLIGESFSGPLVLRLACRGIANLRAVVLVATFVRNPVWWFPNHLRFLVRAGLFRFAPPDPFVRFALAGRAASPALMDDLRRARDSVSPEVLAARAREILKVDVTDQLRQCPAPILYLGGTFDRTVSARRTLLDLRRIRPDMESTLLEAPHLLLQTHPREAALRIEQFLHGLTPKNSGN